MLVERKYIDVLTSEGVPRQHISAGLLSCPRNYSTGCKVDHSSGSQGDWTAARLKQALNYLERVGVPEIAVWPAAGWLDGTPSLCLQRAYHKMDRSSSFIHTRLSSFYLKFTGCSGGMVFPVARELVGWWYCGSVISLLK